jgi:hypothetical protein
VKTKELSVVPKQYYSNFLYPDRRTIMFKRLICLTSVVLVLGMAAASQAGLDDDPNLVAWWKFDGDAMDSSGNDLHGSLMGNPAPVFVDGMIGQALDTTEPGGPGYVEITGYDGILGGNPFSITAWINTSDASGTFMGWGSTAGGTTRFEFRPDADELRAESSGNVQGLTKLPNNEWIHIAVTVRADAVITEPEVTLYLNGQVDNDPSTGGTAPLEMAAGNDLTIARRHTSGRWFDALIDDVRLYSRELTAEEVRELATPPKAYKPGPADGDLLAATWASLQWSPSYHAVSHDVYVDTSFDDVNDGTGDAFRGNQTANSLTMGFPGLLYPEGLSLNTTFYWRVDEVLSDGTKQQGDVWSFFVPPANAYNPQPTDGIEFIASDAALTWEPGLSAVFHNVYVGENFDDVNNVAGGPPVFDTTHTPGALERGKTYYWRVDEFNGASTVKGDVWSFTTIPPIAVGDPNLVGWWKFDEGMGVTAVDSSGYDHHGTIRGDAVWAGGYAFGALDFTGEDNFVEMTGYEGVTGTNPRTMTAWIRTTQPGNVNILSWGVNTAGQKWRMRVDGTGGLRAEVNGGHNYGGTNIRDGRWHHVAVTWEDDGTPDALDFLLYVDGQRDPTLDSADEPIDTSATGVVRIGESPWHNQPFVGLIDEVRIYDKVLTLEEIQLVMRVDPLLAWAPSPAEGSLAAMNVASTLNFSAGDGISQHDVYFDPNQAAVEAADASDTTGVYRGRQSTTSYALPEGVDPNSGPFYWRIDEVANDGTIVTGRIWSFSVSDYSLVDDFESYNDIPAGEVGSNLVYAAWVDGFDNPSVNGSTMGYVTGVSMETDTVHSGNQSVPFEYNNTTAGVSEVVRTFAPAQDWTANGMQTLSLSFVGASTNVPGQLYVKVNGAQVNYTGGASNLTLAGWQSWNIDLASIGTNLNSVTSLAIGIQGPGATGTLLLDDIRLYPLPREVITPVQPNAAGLVLHYAFEGNTNDSTGANPGLAVGGPVYLQGKIGQAIMLDGLDDYVAIDNLKYDSNDLTEVSVSAWIRTNLEDDQIIVAFDRSDYYRLEISGDGTGPGKVGWEVFTDTGIVDYGSNARVDDDQWHHVAGVFDNGTLTVYIDGTPQTPAFGGPTFGSGIVRFGYVGLGSESEAFNADPKTPADYFTGSVDDVRIYDRALTDGEVAGLAGRISPFDKPF